MTDAIALLALSQLVCLGALAYLYAETRRLRRALRQPAPAPARRQPWTPRSRQEPVRQVPVDVAALARRLNRSEDEVRYLLQRQGVLQ